MVLLNLVGSKAIFGFHPGGFAIFANPYPFIVASFLLILLAPLFLQRNCNLINGYYFFQPFPYPILAPMALS